MLMPIDRKFCDRSTLYMTCFKIVNNIFQTSNQILCFPWAISELFSIASAIVCDNFCDNFYLESHSIWRAACFWHDEKNNSKERDTQIIETIVRLQ